MFYSGNVRDESYVFLLPEFQFRKDTVLPVGSLSQLHRAPSDVEEIPS